MGFFMANNLAVALIGPPAIWNRPWQVPLREDLVGDYLESERHLDESRPPAPASLTLRSDGSMTVANLPADFGTSTCTLSGRGSWAAPDDDGIHLTVVSDEHWLVPIRFIRRARAGRTFKALSLVLDSRRSGLRHRSMVSEKMRAAHSRKVGLSAISVGSFLKSPSSRNCGGVC